MKYVTKETIEKFVKANACIDAWCEQPCYFIYVDEDGKLYDEDGEGRTKIFETIEKKVIEETKGDLYQVENDQEFEEYFDLIIENLTAEYVDMFGEIVDDDDDDEKFELGYYNEDTGEFHFDRGSYATFEKAMKAADDAGNWFDTVIGDHRAIDVVMSMAYHFDVDTEKVYDIDELVLEIERRHSQKATEHDWEETEEIVNKIKAK